MTPKRLTKDEFLAKWKEEQKKRQVEAKRKADTEYAAYVKQCINKRQYKWRKIGNDYTN